MSKLDEINNFPQAVTIAGTDSGGGAGVMADLKTMQECGTYAAAIVVAVTAQNTIGVQDIATMSREMITAQFDSLADDLELRAAKTGMLADAEHVQIVVDNLKKVDFGPLTVDPVMIAKGGATLLKEDAIALVKNELVPLATLITPNLPEAEKLCGFKINSENDMIKAGEQLQQMGAKNVLIKGGHLDTDTASDFVLLEDGKNFWLNSPRVKTKRTHGTGDTFSSAITAFLAQGESMEQAIRKGKRFVEATIKNTIQVGHGHGPLNHWAGRKELENDI